MAGGGAGAQGSVKVEGEGNQNYSVALSLMISLFFMFGFITVLNDILIPHLKGLFDLKQWQAMLVQTCFFIAYFVMSVPAGMIIEKIGYKKGVMLALAVVGVGLLLFVPASNLQLYGFFLFALFVVGSGITILQVAANPYISALGSPEKAGSRLTLAGGFNSLATAIGPVVGGWLIFVDENASAIEKAESVQLPYVGLAIFAALLAVFIGMSKLPKLSTEKEEGEIIEGSAWEYAHLIFGAVGIFFYVGAEVAIGSILIDYLGQEEMGAMSHMDAAKFVSLYWTGAMIGRFVGAAALQKIQMNKALTFVCILALMLVVGGMVTTGAVSAWSLVAVGLVNSIMWPCIFPLSLKKLGKHTSQGSGILVSMVVGGALIPPLQGWIAESVGYQLSFGLVLISYAYILWFALKGFKIGKISSLPEG
jgi:FHS family L-fucose permease-like MFS transporter